MKTTIDLPDPIFKRTKIAAAQRGTSIKNLVIEGLEHVLNVGAENTSSEDALSRLKSGYHLGSKPLTRDQAHAD